MTESGWPRQAGVRTQMVRGVVAGASEKVPLMNLIYELRGRPLQQPGKLRSRGRVLQGRKPEICRAHGMQEVS